MANYRTAQLEQIMPTDTNNTVLFSPPERDRYVVQSIIICNNTATDAKYRIFHDEDGTTYSTATALCYDITLAGNTTTAFEVDIYMNNPSGNLSVRSDTANALTFTAYGNEGSL